MDEFATWPTSVAALTATQEALADERPAPWLPSSDSQVAGCFAAFPRGRSGRGQIGDPLWAGAATFAGTRCVARPTARGQAGWPYVPGLLALRIGPTLDAVVRALPAQPDVLLVDATGRDHPRRCGLALQLGAVLGIPTVGVTHRTLLAEGDWPDEQRGSVSRLLVAGTLVGYWVRTRRGRRPLAVHAAWRTDPDCAARVVLDACRHRTPRPLREARRLARQARASAGQ